MHDMHQVDPLYYFYMRTSIYILLYDFNIVSEKGSCIRRLKRNIVDQLERITLELKYWNGNPNRRKDKPSVWIKEADERFGEQ